MAQRAEWPKEWDGQPKEWNLGRTARDAVEVSQVFDSHRASRREWEGAYCRTWGIFIPMTFSCTSRGSGSRLLQPPKSFCCCSMISTVQSVGDCE